MKWRYNVPMARIEIFKDGVLVAIVRNVFPKPTVSEANELIKHKVERV